MSRESKAAEKITGKVEAIYITSSAGEPMQPLSEVRAITRRGLEGDRYLEGTGYYSKRPLADGSREVTFVEAEELERLGTETGIHLDPSESRRNVLTRSVRVNGLIGKRFQMGEVVCEGTRICEPCTYLERLTGKRVMRPLVHRGGLRARIVSDGTVKVGDEIFVSTENPIYPVAPAANFHGTGADTGSEMGLEEVYAEGILRKVEFPSFVDGSHYLESERAGSGEYALVSGELQLDDYLGINVRAFGYLVDGTSNDAKNCKLIKVFLIGAL